MNIRVKSFIWWILISATIVNSAYLGLPAEDVPRVRRSGTTVCVEVRPTRSHEEPYYMCKGGEMPDAESTATFRPFASAKSFPAIKPRSKSSLEAERDVSTTATFAGYRAQSQLGQQPIYSYRPQPINDFNLQRKNQQSSLAFADPNQQVWAFPRFQQQTTQTKPILQPALQSAPTERTVELHAQNAPYFATAEKPFQTLQTQYRFHPHQQPNEFQNFRLSGQEQASNSFIPRHRYQYSEPDPRSSFPFTANYRNRFFGEPGQSSNFRFNPASENDSPNTNEQFSYGFPATLDQLVTMDRSAYEPFTGIARSNAFQAGYDNSRQSLSDQDLSFGNVNDFTKTAPQQAPVNLIVDLTPEELRQMLIQPTVPEEFMSDPVLRTFYSSLEDQNALARSLQGLLKESESEYNENTKATTPINKQTAQKTEIKPLCPSCERTTNDDENENFSLEKVSSSGPCASKDFNWPPVVIAMPCCGQQSNTPSTSPLPTAGFYNPYSMPILSMFPSLMAPAIENTNYAQAFQHQNYQNMPKMSTMNSQSRSHETTTTKTIAETIPTSKPAKVLEEVTESTPHIIMTTESKGETMKTDMPAETTTTAVLTLEKEAAIKDVTEVSETLKPKDDIPKTFETMLNRAKTFKELAEAEMKEDALNHDAKKGKRQNFKDANAALRTIAEVVAASNKRKYSTVIH